MKSLLSSLARGATGVLNGLSLTRILAWLCVLLLAATLVLGSLLRSSYEHTGALEKQLEMTSAQIVNLQQDKKALKDSCEVTTAVLGQNARIKQMSERATNELVRKAGEILNENAAKASGGGNSDAVLQLLDAATCKARNNGLPCHSGKPSDPL